MKNKGAGSKKISDAGENDYKKLPETWGWMCSQSRMSFLDAISTIPPVVGILFINANNVPVFG